MTSLKIIVENTLKNMEDSVMSISELRKELNNKINREDLTIILNEIEERGKIFIGQRGITWIYSNSQHLKSMLRNSLKI